MACQQQKTVKQFKQEKDAVKIFDGGSSSSDLSDRSDTESSSDDLSSLRNDNDTPTPLFKDTECSKKEN